MLNFARPDFIETHEYRSSLYCPPLHLDPRFLNVYAPLDPALNITEYCKSESPAMANFVRKDILINSSSAERQFISAMQANLSPETVRAEIDLCNASDGDCTYITRTVFRNIPELVELGQFDSVLNLFDNAVDRDYLIGWRDSKACGRVASHFQINPQ